MHDKHSDVILVPTGPFLVGKSVHVLSDPTRHAPPYPAGRLIPIHIYFPMGQGTHKPFNKIYEERAPKAYPPLEAKVHSTLCDLDKINTEKKHPIIFLNHADLVAMTDYATIAEDLASHGYVVITAQHQLETDSNADNIQHEYSMAKYLNVTDNMIYLYDWMHKNQKDIFLDSLNLKKVGLIGHSLGANALLLLALRSSSVFRSNRDKSMVCSNRDDDIKEAIVLIDPTRFSFLPNNQLPALFLFAHDRKTLQHKNLSYQQMIEAGHEVIYYEGTNHLSFMDHGFINPSNPIDPDFTFFDGSIHQRETFFQQLRKDIRQFLYEHKIN